MSKKIAIKDCVLMQRLKEIVKRQKLPDFLQRRVDEIPQSERHKYLAVFDADGVLWKEDIADEITGWSVLSGYTEKHYWYDYERIYRPDHEKGCIFLLEAFRGVPLATFMERVTEFYTTQHEKIFLREIPCAAFVILKELGFRTMIVTASPTSMLVPAAELFGAEGVLGMDFEVDAAGVITGRLAGASCYGAGKAQKIIDVWGSSEKIFVCAGDAPLDAAMMEICEIPWACQPDANLLAIAKAKGWEILHRPPGEPVGSHADKFDKWKAVFG